MWSYVNHQAMSEIFLPLEAETDPVVRANILESVETEFATRIIREYERTTFELKQKGWNTGQISEALGISERKVKLFIRSHADNTGQWNPLARRTTHGSVIDITHLVQRSRRPAKSPSHAHDEPESL
jgi:hypothetical protein